MLFPNVFLFSLRILSVLCVASAGITQYMICNDDQEFLIKAAVGEARSLAQAADKALNYSNVVYSESYEHWFSFANHERRVAIMRDNYKTLQILSSSIIRVFAPADPAKINPDSILYVSVDATASLCVHNETLALTNSEALPAPYSIFSSVILLCPSFFELPIATRRLDEYGAGKTILYEARQMNYVAGLLPDSTLEDDNLFTMEPLNSSTSCYSALCCSDLDTSQKHRNTENSVKFALDARYRPVLTQGDPCFTFKQTHPLRIQPRACESVSYSVSHSVSYSKSSSISHSISHSASYSISMSVSYSLSYLNLGSTTETRMIPYTYTGTGVPYTYSGTTVPYTYSGTTVPYTYIGTTVAYTYSETTLAYTFSGATIPYTHSGAAVAYTLSGTTVAYTLSGTTGAYTHTQAKRIDSPSPSLSPSTSFPSSSTPSSLAMKNHPTPKMVTTTRSPPTSTTTAPTLNIQTKTCSATTTFPARTFLPAEESRRNGLLSTSQLNQLLQHLILV